MNAKHTPGPWIVSDSSEGLCITMEHGVRIAELYGVPSGRAPETPEANARLIAAAPELLEALRLMLIPVDALGNHGGEWGYSSRHAQAARAAILKATGEAL